MSDPRPCSVYFGHGDKQTGMFIQYGTRVIYDEGNNPIQVSSAIVEMDSGRVVEVEPSTVIFGRSA